MNCPIDNSLLAITERQGVEIDYCPQCRGVWLDRGELDKIIDKTEGMQQGSPQPQYRPEPEHRPVPQQHYKEDNYHHKKKRKESFLGDLFDF